MSDDGVGVRGTLVFTADAQHRLILSGQEWIEDTDLRDSFIMYDLKDQAIKTKVSTVRCPKKSHFTAVMVRDKQC